jgi:hypothetical protein
MRAETRLGHFRLAAELAPVQTLVNSDHAARRVGMIVEFGTGKVVDTKSIVVAPT